MTTPTHGTIALIIGAIIAKIDLATGIIVGSILGISHHLITDRFVFEWGFWHEKTTKEKIIKALPFIIPYAIYGYIVITTIQIDNLWLLVPAFFGILPDLVGVKFPFHENTQTWEGTLSPVMTVFVEFLMVVLFWGLLHYTTIIQMSTLTFILYISILLTSIYIFTISVIGKYLGRNDR